MKKRFLIFLLIIAPLCINAVHASEDNAKLQLLKEKHYETEGTIVTVKIPHVVNVKDDKVKKVINKLIKSVKLFRCSLEIIFVFLKIYPIIIKINISNCKSIKLLKSTTITPL